MNPHAGRSNDERVAAHTRKKLPSLEQPGGPMAVEGSESDITHSSGQLSEAGKEVWRTGAGMDGGGKSAPPEGIAGQSTQSDRTSGRESESSCSNITPATTLEGHMIIAADGQAIGKVREIMLDLQAGRIVYVVVSTGGFLGFGNKLFALPWSALTFDATRRCLLLAISSERLKSAPHFDKHHWPSMVDCTWASVDRHYGREPYWHALGADEEYERQATPAEDLDPDAQTPAAKL
jgi:sporulation protein YlmC with PRC-barrel domain